MWTSLGVLDLHVLDAWAERAGARMPAPPRADDPGVVRALAMMRRLDVAATFLDDAIPALTRFAFLCGATDALSALADHYAQAAIDPARRADYLGLFCDVLAVSLPLLTAGVELIPHVRDTTLVMAVPDALRLDRALAVLESGIDGTLVRAARLGHELEHSGLASATLLATAVVTASREVGPPLRARMLQALRPDDPARLERNPS